MMSGARVVLCVTVFAVCAFAQRQRGELRIAVHDGTGAALAAAVDLASDINQLHRTTLTDAAGQYTAQDLPFGVYRVRISRDGFEPSTQMVRVNSEVPVQLTITLGLAAARTSIDIAEASTLIDPERASAVNSVGAQAIAEHLGAQPGRGLLDLINAQPGWLYEANGALHPRGSEYAVQFVVDGVPLTENRSPAFAPNFESDDVDSMRVLTAGYPAEYGRKLGGVVELTSPKDAPDGFRGSIALGGGSFGSSDGAAGFTYGRGHNRISATAFGAHSERYLDPPVLDNFTNSGSSGGGSFAYSRDLSSRDRIRAKVTHTAVRFEVPNELVQQRAGQRQDRTNVENAGLLYYQRVVSPSLLFDAEGSVRDNAANFWSNPKSTPILAAQQRGFREGYIRADLAWHYGHHDFKIGADGIFSSVNEALQYTITDRTQFDRETRRRFNFAQTGNDREQSAFVQDGFHARNWNISAGIRWDRYRLATAANAWSPRISVSRYLPKIGLLVHASYDRAFQTPAIENILLASSPGADILNDTVLRLPVQPSRANFYEIGFSRAFWGKARLDANVFRRDFRNYGDDDVLLNTGVSFPIAFANARIRGEEIKLEIPRWGRFSGFASYTNQRGIAQGPVTGGLFLGDESATLLTDRSRFYVSQDQRSTARARVRAQLARRAWAAFDASYGSGLPAELGDGQTSYNFLLAQYGAGVLERVDLERQRVRPSKTLGLAGGVDLLRRDRRTVTLEAEAANLTDRLNVINFASLFSGTAIGAPRSVHAQLRFQF
ncbi:MAG TPA: TonB-dependent receptor [Candidatus Solibacter sp.]|nr:TonB-dependent receptor [Candidatus Solibacter sp.]